MRLQVYLIHPVRSFLVADCRESHIGKARALAKEYSQGGFYTQLSLDGVVMESYVAGELIRKGIDAHEQHGQTQTA